MLDYLNRDDLVFFVFLYQKWVYRVDYTRVNEFGFQPSEEALKSLDTAQTEPIAKADLSDEVTEESNAADAPKVTAPDGVRQRRNAKTQ
jgi:hypothetical protein